ncbi:hypothetical protein O1611_g1041 [Lasiodiplodia mahajangana]|uniref:Uncharacterized protein n=1 Tax=Lasiodiplodia mahajangana TaxID=1108764 RepID=A0ACC2JYP4_9PEZI|nr:hypothetical protein O1611_g1041 [Lasiodiplodia mahajangana]
MSNKPIRIAIFGSTGAGKTSFINNATGANLEVGEGANSSGSSSGQSRRPKGHHTCYVIGVSGQVRSGDRFGDTDLEDPQLFLRVTNWLANSYKQKGPLNGAIFLQSISQPRVELAEMNAIQLFEKILGDSAYPWAMVVSSFWNQVNEAFATKNESNREKTWQRLGTGGARFGRFHATEASALQIVQHFLNFRDAPLLLPQEAIQLQGQVWSTSAAIDTNGSRLC